MRGSGLRYPTRAEMIVQSRNGDSPMASRMPGRSHDQLDTSPRRKPAPRSAVSTGTVSLNNRMRSGASVAVHHDSNTGFDGSIPSRLSQLELLQRKYST